MLNGAQPGQPSHQSGPGRGPLLAIGGAEDKLGKRSVLSEFVRLAGGPDARIAVVPTASSLGPEIVDVYDALFRKIGAADVWGVRPESREEAEEIVRRADRDRHGYFRYLFNVDWLDPLLHDLVIDTASIGVPSATEAVCLAVERMQLQPTPETLARLQDLAATSRAEAEKLRY